MLENCGGRIEEIACEDRISALPEDLLVTILLSIPTKDAIATMILSKRWRFIWTKLPYLVYRENNDGDDAKSKRSVWWFLNKSMEFHKAHVLQLLSIKLGRQCPTDANLGKWVENAVNRGVLVLFFCLRWSGGPTSLPKSLYTCKTLSQLTLSNKIFVDFPSSSCLPSLKKLDLFYVVYKDEASLVTFLSSCPVLEFLCVKRRKVDNVAKFSVKGPSLRFLSYDNCYTVATGRSFVMDTPALTTFCLADYSGDSCSIKNMPCLENASIEGQSFPDIDKLLRSLCAVSHLELFLTDELAVCCSTIKFPQLIKCTISPRDSDWMDSLLLFLGNTPKLKYLTVDYSSTHDPPDAFASWWHDSPKLECLSSSLEKFELIDYSGKEEEEELVTYIFWSSPYLKTATISFRSKVEDKETMMETLKAIYRASKACHFLFKT